MGLPPCITVPCAAAICSPSSGEVRPPGWHVNSGPTPFTHTWPPPLHDSAENLPMQRKLLVCRADLTALPTRPWQTASRVQWSRQPAPSGWPCVRPKDRQSTAAQQHVPPWDRSLRVGGERHRAQEVPTLIRAHPYGFAPGGLPLGGDAVEHRGASHDRPEPIGSPRRALPPPLPHRAHPTPPASTPSVRPWPSHATLIQESEQTPHAAHRLAGRSARAEWKQA